LFGEIQRVGTGPKERLEEAKVGGCLGVSFLPFVFSILPTTFAFVGLIPPSVDSA
jgi:hypothetical protein